MGKGRAPCCDKTKVKRGPWSPEEDLKLTAFIRKQGHTNWRSLPKQADLLRCGKSCRLRWLNYLKPDIKRGNFTKEDEDKIIELHHSFGNKWSKIALSFPGRTDNEIKNVWNTHLKKRLTEKEIVHISNHEKKTKELSKPSSFSSSSSSSSCISNIYQNENQELGEGAEGKNQENGELIENLCPSFSTVATSYSLNADLIDVDIMQTEDTGFLISDSYQDNYEMFIDPNYGVDIFPLDTEFEYLEMLDKEDPICSYQSQANDIEVYQRNIGEENERENECMKWMKNLENEFLLETRSGEEPDYFNFWL